MADALGVDGKTLLDAENFNIKSCREITKCDFAKFQLFLWARRGGF